MFFSSFSPPKLPQHALIACLCVACVWEISAASPVEYLLKNPRDRHLENPEEFFEKRIRPVLAEHCYRCHSAAAARKGKLKGKLQLDTRAGVQQGGASGVVVVPGFPDRSMLIEALAYENEDLQMPPAGKLPAEVIADFVAWVARGAPDPRDAKAALTSTPDLESGRRHWAFRPLHDPPLPAPSTKTAANGPNGDAWRHSPVDRFLLVKLDEKQLHPAPEADRRTLIRRAYFDLIGLPPAPAEVEAFAQDPSPEAFLHLVDRLLASPHYGERWGRHWLDVVRFGESAGATEEHNPVRKDAYRYRDAVIRAFNDDLPFDEFVRLQIAGGIVGRIVGNAGAPRGASDRSNLGLFAHLGTELNNNVNPNDRKFHLLDDMVSTTGQAFLAMTVGCARCHDHKIDPITAEEYYQLTAVFFDEAKVKPDAGGKHVALTLATPHLLAGGSWQRPVKPVEPGFLRVLMRGGRTSKNWLPDGRPAEASNEALASWLTDVEHGAGSLLARVLVNRVWQHHFGRGIVNTPNDFGKLGAEPTHPALLDWLSSRLIESEWRLKPLHRLIMSSAAYRQDGSTESAQMRRDAHNEYLWHRMPMRMEAEVIRDHMLSVSGGLRTDLYGPSIPIGSRKSSFKDTPSTWRRSIYLMSPRLYVHPVLTIFDLPDNTRSTGGRGVSTTPSSAAFMMNAPFVWGQARLFAQRVRDTAGRDTDAQIDLAYRIALSRPPTPEEREVGSAFLRQGRGPTVEASAAQSALVRYCHAIICLNEFIYVH